MLHSLPDSPPPEHLLWARQVPGPSVASARRGAGGAGRTGVLWQGRSNLTYFPPVSFYGELSTSEITLSPVLTAPIRTAAHAPGAAGQEERSMRNSEIKAREDAAPAAAPRVGALSPRHQKRFPQYAVKEPQASKRVKTTDHFSSKSSLILISKREEIYKTALKSKKNHTNSRG